MITAQFTGEKIFSNSADAFTLYERSKFGEKIENVIEYSFVEVLHLISEKKMQVLYGKKELDYNSLMKKIKKIDKKIETKFTVFKDLRKRGYIVKSALKFGAEFRVYDKGAKPGEEHAKWILYTVKENESFTWYDFAAKNRVAHSTKKSLLLAIVDEEGDVSYYNVEWTRP